jgi:phosphohistidine phosphatase
VKVSRTLYVLRHAKSSWDEPVSDHERGLAPRGRRATKALAAFLAHEPRCPDLVLCSSARRATETLDPLRSALGDPRTSVEDDLYGASASQWIDRLRGVDESLTSVMIVGHNPGLADLVLAIADPSPMRERAREKFPTGALATIEHELAWRDLGPGGARLTDFVTPRELPGV